MEKLFIVFAIFTLVFTACPNNDVDNSNTAPKTTLTITNLSDYNISFFEYGMTKFGSIDRGNDVTKEVNEGTSYIFFVFMSNNGEQRYKTEAVTCEAGEKKEFIITNNTIVTRVTNTGADGEKGTLNSFAPQ